MQTIPIEKVIKDNDFKIINVLFGLKFLIVKLINNCKIYSSKKMSKTPANKKYINPPYFI